MIDIHLNLGFGLDVFAEGRVRLITAVTNYLPGFTSSNREAVGREHFDSGITLGTLRAGLKCLVL